MLETMAHELLPIGLDEDLHVDAESFCKLLNLLGMRDLVAQLDTSEFRHRNISLHRSREGSDS